MAEVAGEVAAVRERAAGRRRVDQAFHLGMAAALVGIVFAGFARSFYLRPMFTSAPLAPLALIHGTLFSSWIVLLVAQTALVAAGRTDVHRRVGVAGALVAACMIVVGTLTALVKARREAASVEALQFLVVPLTDMVVFGTLVAIGIRLRRKSESHKRLMLLATIALLPAATGRLPLSFIQDGGAFETFALADVPIAACLLYDIVIRGRPHRALLGGALLIVASQPLRMALGDSQAWLTFARWLVG
jgi:hypothetical protein